MLASLRQRVGRWVAGTAPVTADTYAPATKSRGGSGGIGLGITSPNTPLWNEGTTRRHFTEWTYAAIRATSQRIGGQPVRVGRKVTSSRPSGSGKALGGANPAASGSKVRELPEHPLHEVLDCPCPWLTESQLVALIVSALEISGTAFLWWFPLPGGGHDLLFLPSGWVRECPDSPVPLSRFIVRAENSTEEFTLDASELIRISYPDVSNPLRPFSPLMACYRSVVADGEILDSQVASFQNGGRPGLMVRIGAPAADSPLGNKDASPELTREQRQVLRVLIQQETSGALKSGQPLILDNLIREVDRISNTPQEMDFGASSLLIRDRVLAAFGVPKVILGMTDDANRASAVVSDETFCYHKCGPIVRLISDHFTSFFRVVFNDPDLVVWVEAPRPRDPDGKRADLQQLIGAGALTLDELRAEHGMAPLPNGDGKVMVRAPVSASAPAPSGDPPDRDDRSSTRSIFGKAPTAAEAETLRRLNANVEAGREKDMRVDPDYPPFVPGG